MRRASKGKIRPPKGPGETRASPSRLGAKEANPLSPDATGGPAGSPRRFAFPAGFSYLPGVFSLS